MSIAFELTDYQTTDGQRQEALRVPWYEVTELLGHQHAGTGNKGDRLVAELLMSGAPAWVMDAESWGDEHGWGLIGPEADWATVRWWSRAMNYIFGTWLVWFYASVIAATLSLVFAGVSDSVTRDSALNLACASFFGLLGVGLLGFVERWWRRE